MYYFGFVMYMKLSPCKKRGHNSMSKLFSVPNMLKHLFYGMTQLQHAIPGISNIVKMNSETKVKLGGLVQDQIQLSLPCLPKRSLRPFLYANKLT